MRKTNIFLEVDDRIYDLIVEPYKKEKKFSKLMAALLTGYIEDEHVRAFADGTLDDLHRASVDSLDSVIENMSASLANLGLFTDELDASTNKGKSYFKQKSEDIEKDGTTKVVNDDGLRKDVEELKEGFLAMQKQNQDILSLLKEALSSGIRVESVPEEAIVEEEVVEEPTQEAIDMMSAMMSGNVMSF